MRHGGDGVHFLALGLEPLLDEDFGEDAIAQEPLVVGFERVEGLGEIARQERETRDLPGHRSPTEP
jgi:hypothetical protein